MNKHEKFMKSTIEEAKIAVDNNDNPFGAIIVKNNEIIAKAHSKVANDFDLSKHAEIEAIKIACKKLKTFDLSNCIMYSTGEPCLMCLGAILWVKIPEVYFSNYSADSDELGFTEPHISKEVVKSIVKLEGGILRDEMLNLLAKWKKQNRGLIY
jgi:tRNA(Arg) A34 adenosine deaminase TadA